MHTILQRTVFADTRQSRCKRPSLRELMRWQQVCVFRGWFAAIVWASLVIALSEPLCAQSPTTETLSDGTQQFFSQHCLECHGQGESKGDVEFDLQPIQWNKSESTAFWEHVYDVLDRGDMPPHGAEQPSDAQRNHVTQWLRQKLSQHAKPGGTVLRRLNREEYENTVRDLFDLPSFEIPASFPVDDSEYGFDNLGETLVLSPPLFAEYIDLATQVADAILPPDNGPPVAKYRKYRIGATGLSESKLTSIEGDRFRIVSSMDNAFSAGWPGRFEAPQSGVYRLTVQATPFQSGKMSVPKIAKPMSLSIYAKMKTEQTYDPFEKIRKLAQFDVQVDRDKPQTFSCEIELAKGEAFGLRWDNGAFKDREFLRGRLKQDRHIHAAMLALNKDPRGMSQKQYYDETTALMKRGQLDLKDPRLDEELENRGFGGIGQPNGPLLMISWFAHEESRRFGPALDVTDVAVEGPLRLIEDEKTRAQNARTAQFLGKRQAGATDREYVESVLNRFLTRAFRRPVSKDIVGVYTDVVMLQVRPSSPLRIEDGLHVAVRRALASPNFLFRSRQKGRLDDFDLASRLSYFLTSSPPDDQLFDLAVRGELSKPKVLERETLRLLASPRCRHFVQRFTSQWLGTRLLNDIMPDPRLFFYFKAHRQAMTDEVELFFAEILRENHPIKTFIDPDFSYRNKYLNSMYDGELETAEMMRVTFDRGGRQGGLLGLAAVMMATANGVDTHPVQRGVWLLENVFGTPTPDPPNNVPAISPDTSGTTTMRSQLVAHRADDGCARCHNLIDPLGMVLENYDPVGRWREHYPVYIQPADGQEKLKKQFYDNTGKGTINGPVIDSAGTLTDGTRLNDVVDLKRYLSENVDIVSRCLAGKLLIFATGRSMNFGDKRVVDQLVKDVKIKGNGFRDLIVAVVQSESFRVK